MNISASLNVFRLITNPALCLPHATIPTFNHLPIPVSEAFSTGRKGEKPDIRAIILDKDNSFARKGENVVWEAYEAKFQALRSAYPKSQLLIVSNSAGTNDDRDHSAAQVLEHHTGIPVLRHSTKKPGCGPEILSYFHGLPGSRVTKPSHIAVVGDRLFTDVMMANMMGSWGVWVRDGVEEERSPFVKVEKWLVEYLTRKGYSPPLPASQFEG